VLSGWSDILPRQARARLRLVWRHSFEIIVLMILARLLR